MEREIKFRAWDKINNRIVNVDSIDFIHNQLHFFNETFKGNPTFIIDYKLMQYTGLKDKNDVEIYEGDIVKTNLYNINGYVYYSSPSFGIKQKNGICTDYNWSDFNNFEVIGNIYENKDLLKG